MVLRFLTKTPGANIVFWGEGAARFTFPLQPSRTILVPRSNLPARVAQLQSQQVQYLFYTAQVSKRSMPRVVQTMDLDSCGR